MPFLTAWGVLRLGRSPCPRCSCMGSPARGGCRLWHVCLGGLHFSKFQVVFGAHLGFIFLLFNLKGNMFSNFRHILLMAHHSWSRVMSVRGTEPPSASLMRLHQLTWSPHPIFKLLCHEGGRAHVGSALSLWLTLETAGKHAATAQVRGSASPECQLSASCCS